MMTDVEAWKVWIDFNKNQRGFRWPGSWEPCLLMLSAEWQCGHYQCRGDTWPSPPRHQLTTELTTNTANNA